MRGEKISSDDSDYWRGNCETEKFLVMIRDMEGEGARAWLLGWGEARELRAREMFFCIRRLKALKLGLGS